MSGVLDRMAKRALGRLPTVQPLIRSMYAAPTLKPGEPTAPGLPAPNAEVETSAPTPVRAPSRRSEPHAAAPHRAAPIAPEDERLNKQTAAVPAHAPRRPAEATSAEAAEAPLSPEAEGVEQTELPAPAALWSESEVAPRPGELAADTIAPPQISQPMTPVSQRRRLRAARAESPVPAEQKPEIHISIGSIELRTAPAEPKPATPAAFRPRVSLQDFLSRDRGPRR